MIVSAHDVARALREQLPNVGVVKLHKLLYYAQGWHLAINDEPMFDEPVEAWVNGPVVAELWADEKYGRTAPAPHELPARHVETLEYVLRRYGAFTGKDLIRTTHAEDPWRSLSESDDPTVAGSPVITHDALRSWFQRDDAFRAHVAAVEALRERTDVYSFDPPHTTPDVLAAVKQAEEQQGVREARPRAMR